MTQRRVVACLWGVGLLAIAIIVGAFVLMNVIHKDRPKFVESVIWHVPYTGGAPQYEPEI